MADMFGRSFSSSLVYMIWGILGLILQAITAVLAVEYSTYEADLHGYGGEHKYVEPKYPPHPYGFGYDIKDHHGNFQFRKEHSDGKKVVGSYGYTDAHGIHRVVDYVADKHGFRAKVKTNEPGTANQDPAHVKMQSSAYHGPFDGYH